MIEFIVGINFVMTIIGLAYVFNYATTVFNAQADLIDKLIHEVRRTQIPDPEVKDFLYGVDYVLEEE